MFALTILALAALTCGAPAAQASIGGFEGGDGDQVSANCAAVLDWQCLSRSQLATSLDPSGESDLAFDNVRSGLPLPEIAQLLGISPRTADRLWAYARAWLRQELQDSALTSDIS